MNKVNFCIIQLLLNTKNAFNQIEAKFAEGYKDSEGVSPLHIPCKPVHGLNLFML